MQRRTSHRVYWSKPWNSYRIDIIRGRVTHWPSIIPDSAEWFSWLQRIPSFAFQARTGAHFTARKETRRRGGVYWIAYRHVQGKLRKQYIGAPAQVTTVRLEQIASELETGAR